MAILDNITPAELQPRIDVIKNILNVAITKQEPLTDQKIKAIVVAILDINGILDKNEEELEDITDPDLINATSTSILNSPTTLTLH